MTLDELIEKLVRFKASGYSGSMDVYYIGKNSPVTDVHLYRDSEGEVSVELQGR